MSQQIRVLFSIGSMGGGGSERQLIGILRYLDRSSFCPMLYTTYRQGELLEEVPDDVPVFSFADRFEFPSWNYPGRLFRMQTRHLAEVIRSERIDTVYARTYLMAMVAFPAAKRTKTPWVTVEVADPKQALEDNTARFLRVKKWMLGRAYRHADRVIANSEGVRAGLLDYYGLPAESVTTVHNFLDIDRIERLRREPGPELEPDRFHVVCAGRLQAQKGYHYLLQSADELVNRRGRGTLMLWILGQGPLEAELSQFAKSRGIEDQVRFEGFVPNPCSYLAKASLFCLPSLYEGMPNSLIEAMACRVPVLSTDCPSGPGEILEGGKLGRLVPMKDPGALADAIEDAMDNYADWQAIVPAARERIERDFSPESGIARLEEILREVQSGR